MPSWSSGPHLPQALPWGPEGSRGREEKGIDGAVEMEFDMADAVVVSLAFSVGGSS